MNIDSMDTYVDYSNATYLSYCALQITGDCEQDIKDKFLKYCEKDFPTVIENFKNLTPKDCLEIIEVRMIINGISRDITFEEFKKLIYG